MGKFIDLTGRRYGRLVVIRRAPDYIPPSGVAAVCWECRCDCGNVVVAPGRRLKDGSVKSCGCLRRERSVSNLGGDRERKLGQVDGTNISRLKSNKPQSNNTSGIRGVSWSKARGKWLAYIYLKGIMYQLGAFADKSAAAKARKDAEKCIHQPVIDADAKN